MERKNRCEGKHRKVDQGQWCWNGCSTIQQRTSMQPRKQKPNIERSGDAGVWNLCLDRAAEEEEVSWPRAFTITTTQSSTWQARPVTFFSRITCFALTTGQFSARLSYLWNSHPDWTLISVLWPTPNTRILHWWLPVKSMWPATYCLVNVAQMHWMLEEYIPGYGFSWWTWTYKQFPSHLSNMSDNTIWLWISPTVTW